VGFLAGETASHAVPAGVEVGGSRTRAQIAEDLDMGLAGSLNLRRTALRLLTLLRPGLADWAVLVMPDARTGGVVFYGGADVAFSDVVTPSTVANTALTRVLHGGARVHRDATPAQVADLMPHPLLGEEVRQIRGGSALAVGLDARGTRLGALVMVSGRRFSDDDVALAERIAARAAIALDSARLYEESARIATVLTRSLRPPTLPRIDGVRLAARYRPAAEHLDLGGDFYDVIGSGDDWLLAMGDVCGKGVEAAALTGRTRQSIRTAAYFDRRPAALLHALNTVLHDAEPDLFVTVLCARLRPHADGHVDVELATAGHPAPVVVRADGRVAQPDITGKAAGMVPDVHYASSTLRLEPGDTMLMFTDGVDEARGGEGLYGVDRLRTRLAEYAGAAPDVVCEAVEQDVVEYLDGNPHDDMALLAVTCGR
jgi:phosphoserine phosphatase RsbU/P